MNAPLVRLFGATALAASLAACSGHADGPVDAPAVTARDDKPTVPYDYLGVDGRSVSARAFAGRFTVIAFLTSYDVVSQAEARFLTELEHKHTPRINVAALFLEAPENEPLVKAFAQTLGLSYPVAIADAETIAGRGPFAGLHHVPSVVVLDRRSHEIYRHVGVIESRALENILHDLEQRGE